MLLLVKSKFKFAHLADCHIGGWRDNKMYALSQDSFEEAISRCIYNQVDFVIIAGDLFNNAVPSIELLKTVIINLKRLKEHNIPVYTVAGSHDFSSSGKSILEVLEKADFIINLVKGSINDDKLKLDFTTDEQTGVKLTGMIGKKGMLEKKYYENLDYSIENESGFKIFVFHTALTELMPKEFASMSSMELKSLPSNFNYYAAGHVHEVIVKDVNNSYIIYPGPTFPNNFGEIEKLHNGSFFIVDVLTNVDGSYLITPQKQDLIIHNHQSIILDCNNKNPIQINDELKNIIKVREFLDSIVTLRMFGKLKDGKISDINFDEIVTLLYDKGAFNVLKSTNKLNHHTVVETIDYNSGSLNIEKDLIDSIESKEHQNLANELIHALGDDSLEDEKKNNYEQRIYSNIENLLIKILE